MQPADQANQMMVDALIAEGALWSPPLIAAFRATPRHRFLDRVFQFQAKHNRWREIITREPSPEEIALLYSDQALITRLGKSGPQSRPVPISSSSQPSLMAQMLEDLQLRAGLKVLEIGAGTGYNAALIAHVIGPERLTTIDVDQQVLAEAWDHVRHFPDRQVRLKHADGRTGDAEHAPYDRIMVTASTPDLEPAWLEQLTANGILSAPLYLAPGVSYIVCGTVVADVFHGRLIRPAYFMPLREEKDSGTGDGDDEDTSPSEGLRTQASPWSCLFERKRPRAVWGRFIHALTFYAWLRGHTVRYRRGLDQQLLYGIQPPGGPCCWMGPQEWLVGSSEAREVGLQLYRAFLDAGGPWPSDFQLRASPRGGLAPVDSWESYRRQGPCCQQVWELTEPRNRPGWL